MSHFETYKDKAGQWRYRLRADNGEVVCQSEGYATEDSARRGTKDLIGVVLEAKSMPIQRAGDAA